MSHSLLVLEDDTSLRESLVEALDEEGYAVQSVATAAQALALGSQHSFDLVIADVRIAGPTDGLGVLELLKRRLPALRCVVITGFADGDAPARAVKLLVDDYLHKPFEAAQLLKTVARALRPGHAVYRKLLRLLDPLPVLESSMQAFFVGVRSRLLSRSQARGEWEGLAGELAPEEFNRFYDRIMHGRIEPAQLPLAASLRKADRAGSIELQEAYRELWGA